MPIKSVSTQQAGQALDASHYLQVTDSSVGGPVLIFDIEGEVNSTNGTSYFIQLLNTSSPSSGTTVPLFSRLAVAATATSGLNGFSFVYRPNGIDTSTMGNPVGGTYSTDGSNVDSVYVAISSTDNVYTSVAASTQVTVDFEDGYLEIPTQTITGDLTTSRSNLTVFSDPNPTNKLIQFYAKSNFSTLSSGTLTIGVYYQLTTFVAGDDFTNVGAAQNQSGTFFFATGTTPTTWSNSSVISPVYFIQLFPYASPASNATPGAGAVPIAQWGVIAQTSITVRFGSGYPIYGQGKSTLTTTADYTLHTGCYLYGSRFSQTYFATAGTNWNIKAWNI
jgi:hypothetical protein